jgi:hypothetical protein
MEYPNDFSTRLECIFRRSGVIDHRDDVETTEEGKMGMDRLSAYASLLRKFGLAVLSLFRVSDSTIQRLTRRIALRGRRVRARTVRC